MQITTDQIVHACDLKQLTYFFLHLHHSGKLNLYLLSGKTFYTHISYLKTPTKVKNSPHHYCTPIVLYATRAIYDILGVYTTHCLQHFAKCKLDTELNIEMEMHT